MSSNRSYYGEASDSPERALLLPENERQPQAVPKKETFADLKPYIRPLIATNFISVICGLNDGSIGVIIPRLKQYYGIPNETVSLLFLCNSCGYFVSAAANGFLVHNMGQLGALYFGASLLIIAYLLLCMGFPFGVMASLMLIQGAGIALLDAGMNVYTSNVPKATLMLNILHALYGVGAMLAPVVGNILLVFDIPWNGLYVALASFACLNLAMTWFGLRSAKMDHDEHEIEPSDDDGEREEGGSSSSTTSAQEPPRVRKAANEIMRESMTHPMTILGALYVLVYVGTEVTVGGWGYTFLFEGRHGDRSAMLKVSAGYWAALAVGRIILGFLTERFGEKPMITLFTFMSIAIFVVIYVVPDIIVDSIGLIATGFLLGPMFPSTISLASKVLPKYLHASSIGFIAGLGAGGAALFPFLTGQIAGHLGILAMPLVCLCMAVAMQILWTFVPSDKKGSSSCIHCC